LERLESTVCRKNLISSRFPWTWEAGSGSALGSPALLEISELSQDRGGRDERTKVVAAFDEGIGPLLALRPFLHYLHFV